WLAAMQLRTRWRPPRHSLTTMRAGKVSAAPPTMIWPTHAASTRWGSGHDVYRGQSDIFLTGIDSALLDAQRLANEQLATMPHPDVRTAVDWRSFAHSHPHLRARRRSDRGTSSPGLTAPHVGCGPLFRRRLRAR